jgi:hypothetical protein
VVKDSGTFTSSRRRRRRQQVRSQTQSLPQNRSRLSTSHSPTLSITPARNSQLLLLIRPHTGQSTMKSIDSLTAPFFDNPLYSDIIIKFGEHQLHAHKVILAQQSGYFATAFFSRLQVNRSQIHRRCQTDATRLHQTLSSIWVTKMTPSCLRM